MTNTERTIKTIKAALILVAALVVAREILAVFESASNVVMGG